MLIAQTEDDPEAGARKLTETAFARGSADNITCIVVKFRHDKPKPEEIPQHLEAEMKETKQDCEPKPEVSQLDSESESEETRQS